MLCRPDARAGGISVTFTTAKARKSDRRAPGSKTVAADESDAEMSTTMPGGAKASEAAAAPYDPSPPPPTTTTTESASSAPPLPPRAASSSAAATASPSGLASSIGVYAGFYWWILVITAGIGPTLWSGMALAWHLGACPAAWLCLAASGLYWVCVFLFFFFLLFTLLMLLSEHTRALSNETGIEREAFPLKQQKKRLLKKFKKKLKKKKKLNRSS